MKLITRLFWAAVAFMVLIALFLIITTITRPSPPQEDYQVRAARTEATVTQLKAEAAAGQFWAIFWPIVGAVLIGLFVWAIVTELRHRRQMHAIKMQYETSILRPDVNGNYSKPIIQGSVVNVAPGNLQQPVPSSLHYAPHTIYKMGEGRAAEQLPPPPVEPPVVEAVPTFAELLTRGEIGQGNKILLGYSGGEALRGSWLDLYSSAIAGVSGSGKTTTVRFLAAQSALQGAQFVIIDPHGEADDDKGKDDSLARSLLPLSAAFVCKPAIDGDEIEAAIHIANSEIESRKSDKNRPRTPFIVAVDEFTGLMRGDLAGPLSGLLEKIAQEGRKYGVFALCMGQIWTASRSGGTELRDSFASKYVHRMARNQARLLIPPEESRLVERLPVGQAVLSRTNGELFPVTIPLTTGLDIERVAGLLSARNRPEIGLKYATIEAKTLNPEDARILSLFREGKDVAAIVKEVYGVDSKGGVKYQQLNQQVQAVIRNNI